jgi:hypothetical protein
MLALLLNIRVKATHPSDAIESESISNSLSLLLLANAFAKEMKPIHPSSETTRLRLKAPFESLGQALLACCYLQAHPRGRLFPRQPSNCLPEPVSPALN